MNVELEVVKQFTEYGLIGVFLMILTWTVYKLANKIDSRNTEDRQILSSLAKKLEESNILFLELTKEIKLTREFFKVTIEHERNVSKVCFSELSSSQKDIKEILIKLTASNTSLHKRLDKVIVA